MKKVKATIKLQIPAAQATPAPPVGPALAQHGLNIGEFCQKFNEATKDKVGFTVPVEVTIYEDRSYEFKLKSPLASELLKKAASPIGKVSPEGTAGIEKGSGEPQKIKVGKISREQLKEIAQQKMEDLNTQDIEKAMKIIEGTAKSMGIVIE